MTQPVIYRLVLNWHQYDAYLVYEDFLPFSPDVGMAIGLGPFVYHVRDACWSPQHGAHVVTLAGPTMKGSLREIIDARTEDGWRLSAIYRAGSDKPLWTREGNVMLEQVFDMIGLPALPHSRASWPRSMRGSE